MGASGTKLDRQIAKEVAKDRIQRILDTNKWPSGVQLFPAERALLIANARREGLEYPEALA